MFLVPDLVVVVLRDGRLHGDGAGHGALLAQQGRAGAQREAGHVPDGQHGRRPGAVLGEVLVEGGKVDLLLEEGKQFN